MCIRDRLILDAESGEASSPGGEARDGAVSLRRKTKGWLVRQASQERGREVEARGVRKSESLTRDTKR